GRRTGGGPLLIAEPPWSPNYTAAHSRLSGGGEPPGVRLFPNRPRRLTRTAHLVSSERKDEHPSQ
ncbi:MAG: hypothetical protein ABIP58_05615, partial [Dehalococcoidia bacterium]